MSAREVERVRETFAAFTRGDAAAFKETLDPEMTWHSALVPLLEKTTYQGPDEICRLLFEEIPAEEARAWLADQRVMVGDLSIELDELIEAEEVIVAPVRLRVRPHGSDADFELQIAHLWTLRDGKLIRCEVFPERERALEAAGLRE